MGADLSLESLAGVSKATAGKLEAAGMADAMAVCVHSIHEIKDAVGCDDASALLVQRRAREAVEASGIMRKTVCSAADLLTERGESPRVKSGTSERLDKFLGGGLETRAITEFWGPFGCGKTQAAHQYAVQVQRPPGEGGLGRPVIYVDTENTFRPERVVEMAEARGMDAAAALAGITVMRALNAAHLKLLVDSALDLARGGRHGLLVVDSITKHYRGEYSAGQGWLARRQQALGALLHTLGTAAQLQDLAVLVTNQVVSKPGVMYGPTEVAVGGNVLGHASTYRIQMRKNAKTKRVLKMDDSPQGPQSEIVMHVGVSGLQDEED